MPTQNLITTDDFILEKMSLDSKLKVLKYLAFGRDTTGDMNGIEIAIADDILRSRLLCSDYLPEQLNIKSEISIKTTFVGSTGSINECNSSKKSFFDILRYLAFGYDYYGNMNQRDVATACDILEKRSELGMPNFLPDYLRIA